MQQPLGHTIGTLEQSIDSFRNRDLVIQEQKVYRSKTTNIDSHPKSMQGEIINDSYGMPVGDLTQRSGYQQNIVYKSAKDIQMSSAILEHDEEEEEVIGNLGNLNDNFGHEDILLPSLHSLVEKKEKEFKLNQHLNIQETYEQ